MIQIKNINGHVLYEIEAVCLREVIMKAVKKGANLQGADLQGANLRGADLQGANLRGADLQGASLRGADLQGANLRGADLQEANLRGANLRGANLRGADLQGADLQGANLRGAYLQGADLQGADLQGANLRGALNVDYGIAQTRILPEGDIIGWKKCLNNVIVKLRIPEAAKRSHALGRKCRAEFATVLEVVGAEFGVSLHDKKTEYHTGKTVTCDKWNSDWLEECGGGIHFYITRIEAENHQ